MDNNDLLKKYNIPVPRYTSYPTVPNWTEEQDFIESWPSLVRRAFSKEKEDSTSIYIHLPFCENLCTYCGCNKRITKNHDVETPYIETLLKEFDWFRNQAEKNIEISEIHLGGGTPTFFSPHNLEILLSNIIHHSDLDEDFELAFEGHPNNTNTDHLKTLYDLGSRRVSLGIQDFDYSVQKAINRIQPFEIVERVTNEIRKTGFKSLNFDLIYGLPFQTLSSLKDTFTKVIDLYPERIAFYSYAHVPWKAKGQRGYNDEDLPKGNEKRLLYETGKELLLKAGYVEIGMDHFALPGDGLLEAKNSGKLNRNFMGYTTTQSDLLIGLGVSSISDLGFAYGQNRKVVEEYTKDIETGTSVHKGYLLTEKDQNRRELIKQLICNEYVELSSQDVELFSNELTPFLDDQLIELSGHKLTVNEIGKPFIRNICAVFDDFYQGEVKNVFSSSI